MYVSSLLIFICAKKKNVPKKNAFRSIQLKILNVEKEIPYAISMHLFPHCVSCAY